MIIRICYFTEQGEQLKNRLLSVWEEPIFQIRQKDAQPVVALTQWVRDGFARRLPMIFIGACGIAVRAIAPFVRDKMLDSPVLVMDEQGKFVIPLLSGHLGGANSLAVQIADKLGAQVVLTTATDVEHLFAVDVFAKQNGFEIINREGIKTISAKLLRGERVTVAITPEIMTESGITMDAGLTDRGGRLPEQLELVPFETKRADIRIVGRADWNTGLCAGFEQSIMLVAKEIVIGIGCKKGKSFEELQVFLQKNCPCDMEREVYAMASIDLKKKEEGLWGIAQYYHFPFFTFSAQELQNVKGDFAESDFVKEVTGVSNVCERAAACLAKNDEMLQGKLAENGMTVAIAKRRPRIDTWIIDNKSIS